MGLQPASVQARECMTKSSSASRALNAAPGPAPIAPDPNSRQLPAERLNARYAQPQQVASSAGRIYARATPPAWCRRIRSERQDQPRLLHRDAGSVNGGPASVVLNVDEQPDDFSTSH